MQNHLTGILFLMVITIASIFVICAIMSRINETRDNHTIKFYFEKNEKGLSSEKMSAL